MTHLKPSVLSKPCVGIVHGSCNGLADTLEVFHVLEPEEPGYVRRAGLVDSEDKGQCFLVTTDS